jgi:hypothetical protein
VSSEDQTPHQTGQDALDRGQIHSEPPAVQYSSWLGKPQLATREPWAHGHELLLHPSFSGRGRGQVQCNTGAGQ